ncbi:helix-turn-helix domain-containing protein [Agathobaculum sp. Marseille-P7918]|uniref:helix-turn-helix domain-containing protein n=1 Tax=Agathobaculum sp. Marseille-P7918 TaxID=2479843 RepID=UPI0035672DB1
MNLREKLEFLMSRNNITKKADLARDLDIAYSTIDNILKRDHFDNVKFSTLEKLCDYFHVDLRYLIKDEITDPNYGLSSLSSSDLSEDETQLVEDYRSMNDEGKEKVRDYVADLKDNPKYKKCSESCMDKEA